jgi:hypothetical protein
VLGPDVKLLGSLDDLGNDAHVDWIVNLAGEPILGLPWSAARKHKILHSRLDTTSALLGLIERLQHKPATLLSGSAIGYYGIDAGLYTESDPPADIFQAQLCAEWEQVALRAEEYGVRVVLLRTGVVLGTTGGALPEMAVTVKLGVGCVFGSGAQWVSWIHIDDLLALIQFALHNPAINGPLNGTAPEPVAQREFIKTLARVLHRPQFLRAPAITLRLLLGEMSQLLLEGQQVVPAKALANGFTFAHPTLEPALRDLFAKQ